MDFDQLKGFYYTAKLRSFTGAAKKLFLTQPAISLKVKALEAQVGEKLLERVGRRISLTPAGEILYRQAEALVAKLDHIEEVVRNLQSLEAGQLSLGASDTTSMYFLPELLESFHREHPKVDLVIQSLYSSEVVSHVLDRDVDLGIVALPQEEKRLEVESLFSQKFVCIVAEGHRFCDHKTVKLSDLVEEPMILLGNGSLTRRRVESYLGGAGAPVKVAMELSSFEIIKRFVAGGLGISIVPDRAVSERPRSVRVVPLKQSLSIRLGIVYRRGRPLSHPAAVFLRMARDYFRPRSRRKGGVSTNGGHLGGQSRN